VQCLRLYHATTTTSRIYDYLLGGKDNYQADRDQAARLREIVPEVAELAREGRAFTASPPAGPGRGGSRAVSCWRLIAVRAGGVRVA
jgi:hypothetical protein